MNDVLVRLDRVSFGYSSERMVLSGCNLQLGPHERVGLTGSNGSGKTSLLKIIVGLVRPASGSVEVFGVPRASHGHPGKPAASDADRVSRSAAIAEDCRETPNPVKWTDRRSTSTAGECSGKVSR